MKDKNERNEQKGLAVAAPKKKKKTVLIIVLVVVVLLVAIIGKTISNASKEVVMIMNQTEVEPVQKRDLSDTISIKGTIAGVSKTNVTSKAVSEVTAMNVQVGDVVKAGDVLCTLDSTSIEKQIAELEKSTANASAVESINDKQAADAVAQAKADQATQLNEAQIQIDQAQAAVGGIVQQQQNGVAVDFATAQSAQQALEAAQRNYNQVLETTSRAIENAELNAQLNQYKDSDSTAKDTLADLREQLEDCEVVAPTGGVVTAVNVSVGDINGEKTTILTIEDTSSLKVVASVEEADILKLEEGMNAVVTADATGDEEIKGTVTRVVRVKSQGSVDGTTPAGYSVEISIENKELLIGMDAKAKIMIQEKGEVLAIPYDLIQYDENGKAYVYVAEPNEDGSATAVKKNVEVGEEIDYYTEITGGDLKEGDKLIYDYTFSIVEGQSFAPQQMYSNQDLGIEGDVMMEGADGVTSVEVVE